MSLGYKVLRALITTNDRSAFRKLGESLFLEAEMPSFKFCASHLRNHNKLPSIGTCRSHGHELSIAKEPAEYYIGRLHDRAVLNITNEHQRLLAKAMAAQDSKAIINTYRKALAATMSVGRAEHYVSLEEATKSVVADYDRAYLSEGLQGVTFGWPTMDKLTGGAMPGDLSYIVSRPWMGKTYLLMHSAIQAWRAGHSVAIVSMEMITPAIVRRWIGIDQKINPQYIKMGRLSRWTENRMRHTVEDYKTQAPVHFISGNFQKSVAGIEQVVELLKPDKVYVDGGYLLQPSGDRKYNATHEMLSQVTKELKMCATGNGVPIDATVQFNRQATVTGKRNKGSRMDLKDIGGTDAIGQDADNIMGIRKPGAPFTNTRRIIEPMKVREGEVEDFATMFTFAPMDFSECSLKNLERGEDKEDSPVQAAADLSWMV